MCGWLGAQLTARVSTSVIKGLWRTGVLETRDAPVTAGFASPDWRAPGPELSREQADAAADLRERLESLQAETD